MPLLELEKLTLKHRYQIRRLLKKGSFAEIHQAWDLKQQRDVAVKVLNPMLGRSVDEDLKEKLVENFRQEVSLLAELRHPGIVELLDEGTEMDRRGEICRYLVLEYLPGGDLQEYCSRRPLLLEETLRYFREISSALELAHSRGIVHRDIKPGNLMFDATGAKLKLVDFGVAKRLRGDRSYEITRVGTDLYAPPEHHPHLEIGPEADQQSGRGKLTPAADVYSLAKTIYAAMSGQAPKEFRLRPIDRLPKLLANQIYGDALLRVLRRATAERIADRYLSVRDFWHDFVRITEIAFPHSSKFVEKTGETTTLRQQQQPVNQVRVIETARDLGRAMARRLSGNRRIVVDLAEHQRPQPLSLSMPHSPANFGNSFHTSHPQFSLSRFPLHPLQGITVLLIAIACSLLAKILLMHFLDSFFANGLAIIAGMAMAVLSYRLSSQALGLQPSLSTRQLPSFEFDVVTVDVRGRNVSTRRKQGRQLVENAGEQLGLEMVEIPSGSFWMGSLASEEAHTNCEEPRHRVTLNSFLLGKYPVTQLQWRIVAAWPKIRMNLNPNPSAFSGDSHPVETVSWNEAIEFCERLSQRTGRHYRLPSESEWEYACRAGTDTPFHFGGTLTSSLANYDGLRPYAYSLAGKSFERTTPVGNFGVANAFGLFDMHGNVWEWCQDDWHPDFHGAPGDGRAWVEEKSIRTMKVVRGGAWFNAARLCRSAYRYYASPEMRGNNCGFRVALNVEHV
ncbi:MAG: SUMF1/EgtB/PvdO family nonheme iron enzyme [Acidobacteria bacterium]|nr:SUMF1/EgtB/PvdO family nonheme iron enzyme [Acidobacteriota bacterium]